MDKSIFNSFTCYAAAYIFILFLFILSFVQFYIPQTGSIRPNLIIPIIYFWSLYRPTLIPVLLIFIAGFIYDLFLGYPSGLNSILFLVIYWVIKRQRNFFLGQSYLAIWIGFCVVSFLYFITQYLFFSLFFLSFVNIAPQIFIYFLGVIIFPLLSYVFIKINNILPVLSLSKISVR